MPASPARGGWGRVRPRSIRPRASDVLRGSEPACGGVSSARADGWRSRAASATSTPVSSTGTASGSSTGVSPKFVGCSARLAPLGVEGVSEAHEVDERPSPYPAPVDFAGVSRRSVSHGPNSIRHPTRRAVTRNGGRCGDARFQRRRVVHPPGSHTPKTGAPLPRRRPHVATSPGAARDRRRRRTRRPCRRWAETPTASPRRWRAGSRTPSGPHVPGGRRVADRVGRRPADDAGQGGRSVSARSSGTKRQPRRPKAQRHARRRARTSRAPRRHVWPRVVQGRFAARAAAYPASASRWSGP